MSVCERGSHQRHTTQHEHFSRWFVTFRLFHHITYLYRERACILHVHVLKIMCYVVHRNYALSRSFSHSRSPARLFSASNSLLVQKYCTEVQILTQTRNVCGTVYSESIQLRQKQQHSLAGQCSTHTQENEHTTHTQENEQSYKTHATKWSVHIECSNVIRLKKKNPKMKRQYNHMFYFL